MRNTLVSGAKTAPKGIILPSCYYICRLWVKNDFGQLFNNIQKQPAGRSGISGKGKLTGEGNARQYSLFKLYYRTITAAVFYGRFS